MPRATRSGRWASWLVSAALVGSSAATCVAAPLESAPAKMACCETMLEDASCGSGAQMLACCDRGRLQDRLALIAVKQEVRTPLIAAVEPVETVPAEILAFRYDQAVFLDTGPPASSVPLYLRLSLLLI